jgi:hypothetical protein
MVVMHTIPAKSSGMTAGTSAFESPSADYKAKVNGLDCEVYTARVSAMPFNRWWPGHQRPLDQTELAAIMSFQADEKVTLSVESARPFSSAVLRPLSRGIVPKVSGTGVSFSIEKPGQYVLELDGRHKALHIFVNPVEKAPEAEKAAWYFGEGIHFPGLIRLNNGDSVYLDKGAVVYGSLFGRDVRDITISGYGILDGSYEERLFEHCYEDFTKGNIKFYNSRNIAISGLTLRNSAIWVLNLFGCSDVKIDNIKIVGQWRYNTDGIDVVNSKNVEIKNSFIRSFDDTITLKGIDAYAGRNVTNVHVDNCVLWCGWGRTCEIGLETACKEYKDIVFENCDLIHNSTVCLDIQNGDYADVHDVIFRDLRVEYQNDTLPDIMQQKDEEAYAPNGRMGVPTLIWASNPRFREMYSFLGIEGATEARGKSGKVAAVFDILYENIDVFLEEGVPMPKSEIYSRIPGTDFYNIKIRGVRINGKPVKSFEELKLEMNERVHDITIA